jgi:hypothetical protein
MLKKSFQKLTNEAFASLASETIKMVTDTANTTFTTNPLFTAIEPAYNAFFAVLDKQTFSGMGEQIAALDKRRDKVYSGLYQIIKGWSKFVGEGIPNGETATELLPLFEDVESVRRMSSRTYAQETSAIEHLVTLMDTTENMAKFASLGLSEARVRVRNHNQNFKNAYLQQVNANSAIRQQGTATDKRKALEEAMKDFYALVDSMKKIAPWTDLYSDLEELQMRTKL